MPRRYTPTCPPGLWLGLGILLGPAALAAQDVPLPADLQYTLIARVLSFDRELESRGRDEIVLGVVYQEAFPPSRTLCRELDGALGRSAIRRVMDIPIRIVPIPMDDVASLTGLLARRGVNLVYVAPLRAVDVVRILDAAREVGALTVTGVPAYVPLGVSLGLGIRHGKPRILVNLPSARLEGADLASTLLSLAEVVR